MHSPLTQSQVCNAIKRLLLCAEESPLAYNPKIPAFTVDRDTTEILEVNKPACTLLECSRGEIIGRKLPVFLQTRPSSEETSVGESFSADGSVVTVLRDVVDVVRRSNGRLPVVIWTCSVPDGDDLPFSCLFLEPMESIYAHVSFTENGGVSSCNLAFAHLNGYTSTEQLKDKDISSLLNLSPPLCGTLSKRVNVNAWGGIALTSVCVRFRDAVHCGKMLNASSPNGHQEDSTADLSLHDHSAPCSPLTPCAGDGNGQSIVSPSSGLVTVGTVRLLAPLNGLLTLLEDGTIFSVSSHFALMMFGYKRAELSGKNITFLMPEFFERMRVSAHSTRAVSEQVPEDSDQNDKISVQQALPRRESGGEQRPSMNIRTRLETVSTPPAGASRQPHSVSVIPAVLRTGDKEKISQQVWALTDQCRVSQPGSPTMSNSCSGVQTFTLMESLQTPGVISGHWVPEEDLDLSWNVLKSGPSLSSPFGYYKKQKVARSQESSFEVISIDSRSSSGFSERTGRRGTESGPSRRDCMHHVAAATSAAAAAPAVLPDTSVSPVDDAASSFLDIDSNGGLVSSMLENLDLNKTVESTQEQESCNTAELLRTPSPCVIESEEEEEEEEGQNATAEEARRSLTRGNTLATSTPKKPPVPENDAACHIVQGSFEGSCYRKDGTRLDVHGEIKKVTTKESIPLFCLWLTERDLPSSPQGAPVSAECNRRSSIIGSSHISQDEASISSLEQDMSQACHGPFEEQYKPVRILGKGGYSSVWLCSSCRKHDGEEVVVKFIRKSKILSDCWVDDPIFGRVSQEVSVLYRLHHPNIVKVRELFENKLYFQMVMEKHGDGMDLFDFIDLQQGLDEPLASYIFRQVVSAVTYLHNNGIVHRDIKDENIIIDQNLQIKLIDFGSAGVMEPGLLFYKFRGTMGFCSPEVLQGNPYAGPELEMWALGVLLYMMVFCGLPFCSTEEILEAKLEFDFPLSQELTGILQGLLQFSPILRMKLLELLQEPWLRQPINLADYSWEEALPGADAEKDSELQTHGEEDSNAEGDDTPLQDEKDT